MQQQIAVVTLGVKDLVRSKKFYIDGFGWKPEFENDEIVFYQMNGFVFGTFILQSFEEDAGQKFSAQPSAFSLAHNVGEHAQVQPLIDKLVEYGGRELRKADEPLHGGFRGYVSDPDNHIWEIAWNPVWPIDNKGHVSFKAP